MEQLSHPEHAPSADNEAVHPPAPVAGAETEVKEGDRRGISVARTIVKSEPELAELVAREPRLKDERIEVSLTEKCFGTRVAIIADAGKGLDEADLEAFIDQLAEPQKRPFANA